jgi:hypothetical protein
MAIIQLASFLEGLRNKVGGTVYSKNRQGLYMRTRVTPSNPQSNAQTTVRSSLALSSAAWGALTQEQRDEWNNAAANVTITNLFGYRSALTGHLLFMRVNNNLRNCGAAAITDVPAFTPATALTALGLAVTISNGAVDSVDVTFAPTPVPANHKLVVLATPGIPPSRSTYKQLLCRIKNVSAAAASPQSMENDYIARFTAPYEDDVVVIKAWTVHTTSGLASLPLIATAIVSPA